MSTRANAVSRRAARFVLGGATPSSCVAAHGVAAHRVAAYGATAHGVAAARGLATAPLRGLTVLALEQAVAAPFCTSRLADGGARVIKVERPGEGDFARRYDTFARGGSSYFAWLNRGKESLELDLKRGGAALLRGMVAAGKVDVVVQNLAPGALTRLGLGSEALRALDERLVTVDISGYGEQGPRCDYKAYDLLVAAEAGLCTVTGSPEEPGRVGVSVCDLTTGMNAYAAVLQGLLTREKSGRGGAFKVSMFDTVAELMVGWFFCTRLRLFCLGNS
jgi:itaconate CoA-transferase